MAAVFFFIAAIGAIAGALGTVALRNPFYSVLSLVCHLISLAALFLLLRAEFVAAAQVIVYAGAVMVLYVFVVAYVGGMEPTLSAGTGRGAEVLLRLLRAGAVRRAVDRADRHRPRRRWIPTARPYKRPFGEPAEVGRQFLTTYLVVFEVASLLLLVAAVGAVILARRRCGPRRTRARSRSPSCSRAAT